ncbi:MAG: S-adenosyl-l-methionine hydroxide adenosyltransferase family protein [Thermoplasmata archaeon]
MSLITLLTDFGPGKYVAAMKGVILSIDPQAKIVDIEHRMSPQGVLEGAFVLASAVKYFPFAIHVAVVDPGVGTRRRSLVMECRKGTLVGPDNGLLLPAARVLGLRRAFSIDGREYCLPEVSDTFHGRDVFAPVAAHLGLGISPSSVGSRVKNPVDLDFGVYEVSKEEVRARILFRDRFGNLVTNLPEQALPSWISFGKIVELEIEESYKLPFLTTYASRDSGEPLLTISSDGFLEIAVNRGDASDILDAEPGDDFILKRV